VLITREHHNGEMKFTGTVTLTPFSTPFLGIKTKLSNVTATQATGIFASFVSSGDALVMSNPDVEVVPPVWSIGGPAHHIR